MGYSPCSLPTGPIRKRQQHWSGSTPTTAALLGAGAAPKYFPAFSTLPPSLADCLIILLTGFIVKILLKSPVQS